LEAEERRKADEKEKLKAGNGMMLATSDDASALENAWWINAENARIRAEGFKLRTGSSKASGTPTPKPKSSVNLVRQVREEERLRKTGNQGKSGDLAVSTFSRFVSAFLTSFFRMSCAIVARIVGRSAFLGPGELLRLGSQRARLWHLTRGPDQRAWLQPLWVAPTWTAVP
jgi:hypothetical protein